MSAFHSMLVVDFSRTSLEVKMGYHGICENVTWHIKMSQMSFSRIQARLELVFGGNFCELHLYVFIKYS